MNLPAVALSAVTIAWVFFVAIGFFAPSPIPVISSIFLFLCPYLCHYLVAYV